MMTNYFALVASSNLKGHDDTFRYYIEPSDGGGIEYVADTLEEAKDWCARNNGVLEEVI